MLTESTMTRANASLRNHLPIFEVLGFAPTTLEERKQALAILNEVSERGRTKRRQLMDVIDYTSHEFLAQGSDMNQRYTSSAVFVEGAGERPPLPSDPALYHEPHTFPGLRLPHAWLNTAIPQQQLSTLDLAGKGRFTLFTGHGGDAWRTAAISVSRTLGIDIAVFAVGYGLQYEAVYNDWYRLREVGEDGCVLVRPDNFIAWRSKTLAEDCSTALRVVFQSILAL